MTLLLGGITGLLSATAEYRWALATAQAKATTTLQAHPEIQLHLYKKNTKKLKRILAEFLKGGSFVMATAYSSQGTLVARHDQSASFQPSPPPLSSIRDDLLTADSGLASFDSHGEKVGHGPLESILNLTAPLYFSQPVITAINPTRRDLIAQDFSRAINSQQQSDTRWVIGYVNVVIDRRDLFADAGPALLKIVLLSALLASLTALLTSFIMRRTFGPLKELSALAEDVAAGRLENPAEINGSPEIKRLAVVFNSVVGGLQEYKRKQDAGKQLLNLKVEERSTQLDARNAALIKAKKQANLNKHRLHHLANYDKLTGLPNRQLFATQLELLLGLNKYNSTSLSLFFIDLDDFKKINDTLGIKTGDKVLAAISKRLAAQVRSSGAFAHLPAEEADISVSRIGGDEFTVVLSQVESPDIITEFVQRMYTNLSQPLQVDGHEVMLKPSIGIALAPKDGTDVESLLRAASTAKLHAKNASGQRIQLFHKNLGREDELRLKLETDLRCAVQNGEFILHYQPQVEVHSGSVVGVEALLRWIHPEHGLIPPNRFIALAESIGVMDELGDWVLVEACRQVKQFNDEGLQLAKVSINLSTAQFTPRFMLRVATVLDKSGLPPSQLELGLTEETMTKPDSESFNAIQTLKNSGVYLSVDDFGTGYAPLHYLTQFPLDELKIDRHFIVASEKSRDGESLVKAIIAMAHSLNLRVLAQGVETESQLRFLIDSGANSIQGFLFSKPVAADELRSMLKPWHFMEKIQQIIAAGDDNGSDL